ncbi:Rrf2 family transcriptional regulator [Desulfoluna sp.]|uniref:RrF2 family transcriptional regulator n=1 Tax=Desulfoluna sp. TaxID=2045199 RepID=UPI002621EE3C|nr:Rrf2 family transcriptional regulator [Desulfoluna sp.]
MKLSTKSRYGARILVELAKNHPTGIPIQVSEISRRQGIPMKYLEQLVRLLRLAGIVRSVRGPKGGHVLNVPPDDISLGRVVRLFEGQSELVECISSPDTCIKATGCRFRQAWKEATDALYANLDKVKIADLMEPLDHSD